MSGQHQGSALLLRRDLRADLRLLVPWTAVLGLLVLASALSIESLYPDSAERARAATALNNSPATVFLYGPITDVTSVGELAMTKLTVVYAFVVALLLMVVVRRHTRGEEESGRTELLVGTGVGRQAPLTAALLLGGVVSVLVGLLAAVLNSASGLPVSGSLLFGASWTGIGLVATGLTATACQLSASSRACAGIASGALGVLYLVRAVGDVGAGWLGWLSPFGWGTRLQAWSEPRIWVLGLYAGLALALAGTAYVLHARRDLGSGLWAVRSGRRTGAVWLSGAPGLTWRLDRSALGWWTAAVAAMGTLFGFIAPTVDDMLDSDAGRQVIEQLGGSGRLEDTMLAAVLSISAVVITCFGLMIVVRSAGDERDSRTELLLGSVASRTTVFVSTVVAAVAGAAWLLLVTGITMGLGAGRGTVALVPAALAHVPAVALVISGGAVLWSLRTRWAPAAWGIVVGCLVLEALGGLLELPQWVLDLSPYAHVPAMPVEPADPVTDAWLFLATGVLLLAAAAAYRRRDLV